MEKQYIQPPEVFPSELFTPDDARAQLPLDAALTLAEVRGRGIETIERGYLKGLLAANEGRIGKTAQAAGISARQLHKLMTKYRIRKEEFK